MKTEVKADRGSTLKRVARVTGLYVVAAAGVWQAADVAFEALGLPPRAIALVVLGAIALLPLVVVVAWATSPASISRLSMARRRSMMLAAGVVGAMAAITVVVIVFRTGEPRAELPSDLALATLRETAFSGEIEEAASLADRLAERNDVAREVKLEAYRHVARAAVRFGKVTVARSTLDRMLDLEPPVILLHPSVESAELIALYSAARRARVSSVSSRIVLDSAVFSVGPLAITGVDPEDLGTDGARAESVEAVQVGVANMVMAELPPELTVVERGLGVTSLVGVDSDDPEVYYKVYGDILSGRFPRILVETHAITGSIGANGDRVLVTLWAMDLRSGEVVGHGLAEGKWPLELFETIAGGTKALVLDLKTRAR